MNQVWNITKRLWNHKQRLIRVGLVILGISLIIYWAIVPNYSPSWTGFGEYQKSNGEIERAKTLWDWMNLLIVPLVLAIGVWLLNKTEKTIEQQTARMQAAEATLQMYLDRMTDLFLKENLRESVNEDEVRSIARSRTLTALRGLDNLRKGLLIRFLWESGAILENQLVKLKGADINGADLKRANLTGANLSFANLNEADLYKSRLSKVNLSNAQLTNANLSWTDLVAANLYMTNLLGADLSNSALAEANLKLANLKKADLRHAHLRKAALRNANLIKTNLSHADLAEADFTRAQMHKADLRYANLSDSKLCGTNLQHADLRGAILDNADLSLADLTGAKVSHDQLAKASSLSVAIMMNGKPNNGEDL